MDIISKESLPLPLLDAVARVALGAATSGVSTGDGHSRIHLLSENPAEQRSASDVLANFGRLRLTLSAPSYVEGEAEPVISCHDGIIALDSELAYSRAVGRRGDWAAAAALSSPAVFH